MTDVHPTALVDPRAELDESVSVGAFCRIEGPARIGARTRLHPHVTLTGRVSLGEDCELFPFACLGGPPQDLRFDGEASEIVVGPRTVFREQVSVHPGVAETGGRTVVGADGVFMIAVHIGHDCVVGDHALFANHATLGGACRIGDHVVAGGFSVVHPKVRVGRSAFIGAGTMVLGDVVPFGSAYGVRAMLNGVNIAGLKDQGFSRETIRDLRAAYRLLIASDGTVSERLDDIAALFPDREEVIEVVEFARRDAARNLCLA